MSILTTILSVLFWIAAIGSLGLYLLWLYDRQNLPEKPRLEDIPPRSIPRMLGAVVLEVGAMFIQLLTYPLRLIYDLSSVKRNDSEQTPILLVHGWGTSGHSLAFIHFLLKQRGWKNIYCFSHTPLLTPADKLAGEVARKIEEVVRETGAEKIHIIGHSMGGILTRYAIKHLEVGKHIDTVITLGSPHMGSRVAGIVPMQKGNIVQLGYQSEFMKELAEGGMMPGGDDIRWVSIYSEMDNFVLPQVSAHLEGDRAVNLHLNYHGHIALLYSPTVVNMIARNLRAREAAAPQDSVPA